MQLLQLLYDKHEQQRFQNVQQMLETKAQTKKIKKRDDKCRLIILLIFLILILIGGSITIYYEVTMVN